ncbi:MAG: glucokinase [Rhodospirillaceae bacterium]|nr:glucokinase [Rhodospirillaceae bacterium]
MDATPLLVGDLGATNARFALMGAGGASDTAVLSCADYPDLASAMRAYQARVPDAAAVRRAALAIASPIIGDQVAMTNHAWSFSISGLRAALGLDRLEVVNDFAAVALAVSHLTDADRRQVGGGTARPGARGVLGPGSGLGMASVVPDAAGLPVVVPGEGGHATVPAGDDREAAVISHLRAIYGHVSCERVVSGMGLVNLYEGLGAVDGEPDVPTLSPPEVSALAAGGDPRAAEAVRLFIGLLGSVAGNLALTVGAVGGIYIAGGICVRLGPLFDDDLFRQRFQAKGRFHDYLAAIPTYLVTHPFPAFVGLKGLLVDA